jgi:HAE1 family hydrophobic/amphiphilic exporter-1
MGCVPFAFLGVVWLFMATGTPFNLMAGIGTVILIGIVVNNGIVLVDHINHHRKIGSNREDAIMAGCAERLRPILMTAGTTILGLLPLTLIVMPTYYRIADTIVTRLRACLAGSRKSARGEASAPSYGTGP